LDHDSSEAQQNCEETSENQDAATGAPKEEDHQQKGMKKKRFRIKKKVGRFMNRLATSFSGSEDEEEEGVFLEAEVQVVTEDQDIDPPNSATTAGVQAESDVPIEVTSSENSPPVVVESDNNHAPVRTISNQSQQSQIRSNTVPTEPPSDARPQQVSVSNPSESGGNQVTSQEENTAKIVRDILQVFPTADEVIIKQFISQGMSPSTILAMVADQETRAQLQEARSNQQTRSGRIDRGTSGATTSQTTQGASSLGTASSNENKGEALARLHDLFPAVDFKKKNDLLNRMGLSKAIETLIEEEEAKNAAAAAAESENNESSQEETNETTATSTAAARVPREIPHMNSSVDRLHDAFPDVDVGLKRELLTQMSMGKVVEYLMEIQGN